jgi:hypothetical protein
MAEPTRKSEGVEAAIANTLGQDRRIAIRADRCQPAPIGCGGPATEFRDHLSAKEYRISGLCQKCQDAIFG